MASAGLLKLLSTGLQDERLASPKGQPRIDIYQKAYIKAGRFTTEWYGVDFDNAPSLGQVSQASVTQGEMPEGNLYDLSGYIAGINPAAAASFVATANPSLISCGLGAFSSTVPYARASVPRRGQLINSVFLVTTMPDIITQQIAAQNYCKERGLEFAGPVFGWTNSIGHAIVGSASVSIGGSPIDTLDGRLMEMMDEFHTPLEKMSTVNRMIGRASNGFSATTNQGKIGQGQIVSTPLPFWFCRGDPASALPIDAIGQDAIQIQIGFNPVDSLYTSSARALTTDGKVTLPPMGSSPFYYLDPLGKRVAGLTGDPLKTQLCSQIPGINMPASYKLGPTYLLVEYVYIDNPEANRIRLSDLSYPIVQHYAIDPFNTNSSPYARIPMRIPNPARDLYMMCHRKDADLVNAPFLATRDLSYSAVPIVPWWPDASGVVPAYSKIDSEPIKSLGLYYEGKMVRLATDAPMLFRSVLSGYEQRKTPWNNKYYYHIPFGRCSEFSRISNPLGEANLDKIPSIEMELSFKQFRGSVLAQDVPQYTVYIWVETYNILRVYGGRASLLFAY